ncbi:MAG TPA: ABC transporter permease [Haliangiales bacterium]|nr:ABC transporter permease [Haliangiales bacterium]
MLRQNLRRNLWRLILSGFGIAVGIAAFVFFWGLSQGVSSVVLHDIFPIDRVEVISPKTSFTGVSKRLDDALVQKILARAEVASAYPKLKMAFPARGEGQLLGNQVRFEVAGFCDGIDPVLLENDPGMHKFKDWEEIDARAPPMACDAAGACPEDRWCAPERVCRHRVPVLISRTIIEIYNGGFADSHGLPRIGAAQEAVLQSKLKDLWFTMALGESYVQGSTGGLKAPPERVQATLVGISDKAMAVGMTIPIGYLKRWNARYAGPDTAKAYSSIVVVLKDRKYLSDFITWVKSEGYTDEYSAAEQISLVIIIVTALFVLIAFTIMFISAVNISHTFFMMISERRREIGLMRALGASRGDIWKIILGEAAVIGLGAGAIGTGAAIGVATLIDFLSATHLPDYPFKPTTYFSFSPILILAALGFAVLFCVVGASLPARRAARIHPAQALTQ